MAKYQYRLSIHYTTVSITNAGFKRNRFHGLIVSGSITFTGSIYDCFHGLIVSSVHSRMDSCVVGLQNRSTGPQKY